MSERERDWCLVLIFLVVAVIGCRVQNMEGHLEQIVGESRCGASGVNAQREPEAPSFSEERP